MKTATTLKARLFGPGMAGGGTRVLARWQDDTLLIDAEGVALQADAAALQVEAAGFNLRQLRVSWQVQAGGYALFIEDPEEASRFVTHAPPSLAASLHAVKKTQRSVETRFRGLLAGYGFYLCLPLIALVLFLLNIDSLAGWAASKVPLQYESRIGDLVLAQARARTTLVDSGPAHAAVAEMGRRLTAGSRYQYRWFVAHSSEVNAFAAPGGVIVVHAGLIRQTARPEELAGVLAHEVAHVEQRHGLRGLIKSAGFGVLLSLAIGDWSGSALGAWAANLTELKFSRDAEMEADREGLRRMVDAGIDPQHMAGFFARLAAEEGRAAALSILSTHPASQDRLQALRRQIDELGPRHYPPLDIDWKSVQASLPGP